MANEVLIKVGTQVSFADHAGDFSPTAANAIETGTPSNVDLAMASLAAGSAVNSDKVDLGATRAREYAVDACLEFAASIAAGDIVNFYWAPAANSTAASGNPGGADGVDGAYTGDSSNLTSAIPQLQRIGRFVCTEVATSEGVQIAHIGTFSPAHRYGQLIVVNDASVAFHSDDVEMNVTMTPIIEEIQ